MSPSKRYWPIRASRISESSTCASHAPVCACAAGTGRASRPSEAATPAATLLLLTRVAAMNNVPAGRPPGLAHRALDRGQQRAALLGQFAIFKTEIARTHFRRLFGRERQRQVTNADLGIDRDAARDEHRIRQAGLDHANLAESGPVAGARHLDPQH